MTEFLTRKTGLRYRRTPMSRYVANVTDPPPEQWKSLLRLMLSQRLELNAIESALKNANLLSGAQIKEIRKQATQTAIAWSLNEGDDVLALIRVHSSPDETMLVPPNLGGCIR